MRLTLLFLLFTLGLNGQSIKGLVLDQEGNPLSFATIYVKETGSGSISNEQGKYELKLPPGEYNITFQFLGYATQQIRVVLADETITRDIVLNQQAYLLGAAEIKSGKEDPAYSIMRKAIAKSAYHRQQVDHYTCEVYLKGGGRIKEIPWFARKALEEEGMDTSATFITENITEITYNRPGQYEERVISIRTQGNDQNTSPMNYINSSLYEPEVGGLVSPFSRKAFAFYKFKYIRTFKDRDKQINEIQVIPRSMGEDVVRGRIFVVEDLWCIHSVNLVTTIQSIDINIRQVYAPVAENVWLPVSHRYNGDGKILGFGFEFQYLATIRDYDITINPELATEFEVLDEKTEKEEIEAREEDALSNLEKSELKLEAGEELTRKELRKLMREYEKQERKEQEEPTVIESRSQQVDSVAYKNDSLYWAKVRPVPLNEREIKGYKVQDSLAIEQEKKQAGDTLNTGKGKFGIEDILLGNTYSLGNDHYITIREPISSIRFNTVDGWNFLYRLNYYKRISDTKRFEISPTFRYGFARNSLQGKIQIEYRYGESLKRSRIKLEGGYFYSQFNSQEPISTFNNTVSSLFSQNNFMKVYDRRYLSLSWQSKPMHNVSLTPYVVYADRFETFNNTTQNWFDWGADSYNPNTPRNLELANTGFGASTVFKTGVNLVFRPYARYYKNGKNYYRSNNPPTITLKYEKAIPGVLESDPNYDKVSAEVQHRFDLNLFGNLAARVEGGYFINNEKLEFIDFSHFMGNATIFTRYAQMSGYSIAPFYDFSTQQEYVSTYVNYELRQFLFTNITLLRLSGVKENINFNHLWTPAVNNYMELGYSVDNIFRFFRIDVTAAFIDGTYSDFRIQLGITSDLISVGN